VKEATTPQETGFRLKDYSNEKKLFGIAGIDYS
jgi:hypothetical protein